MGSYFSARYKVNYSRSQTRVIYKKIKFRGMQSSSNCINVPKQAKVIVLNPLHF